MELLHKKQLWQPARAAGSGEWQACLQGEAACGLQRALQAGTQLPSMLCPTAVPPLPAGVTRQWTGQWFVRYGSCPALSHRTASIYVANRSQKLVSGIPALWQHSWNSIIGGLQPWKAFNTETAVSETWRGEHWVRVGCWKGPNCWGMCWCELYISWQTPDARLRDGWWPTYFLVQKVRGAGRWSVYCPHLLLDLLSGKGWQIIFSWPFTSGY